ncbi:MAG: HupE/UreJ family protein [Halieaceae bacterium]|nr:HupE/UreJ family protein [Halieaceae bacterium]
MKAWLLGLCLALLSSQAVAHRFAPSLLQVFDVGEGNYRVVWKTPRQRVSDVPLAPLFPPGCDAPQTEGLSAQGTGVVETVSLRCPVGLVGSTFAVSGLAENSATALFSLEMRDGLYYQSLLSPEQSAFQVPLEPGAAQVASEYTRLGAEHIWEGPDHLMFVFGLFLLVGWNRRLLYTVTAFTLGHSITLSLVTLGLFDYPVTLVEFMIAFSIFLLAVELARREGAGLFRRYPWWLAGGFGLLHGMGFAGALAEVGLPQSQLPLALLFFNVGIELGQLVFIALAAALVYALRKVAGQVRLSRWQPVPVYALGSLSALWCLQRGSGFF